MASIRTTPIANDSNSEQRSESLNGNKPQTHEHENFTTPTEESIEVSVKTQEQFSEVDETAGLHMESYQNNPQYQLETAHEFFNKTHDLRYVLETDLLACDAKWTLFVAAALSYRYDSKLKPFPEKFAEEQSGYNIDALVAVINDTPKLGVILQDIVDENYQEINSDVIELLHWVLVTMREPGLRLVEGEELYNLLCSIDEKAFQLKPTHVFEVNDATGFHSDVAFCDRISNLPVKLAFLGNKLDQYYSLVNNGFPKLPGNGKFIKLTTDLHTSLKHSPNGAAWGASQCGSVIACTAVCEFGYDTASDRIVTNKNNKSCVNIQLHNLENIRVRYLLFYSCRFENEVIIKGGCLSWIYRHKYPLSLLAYMFLMTSIGVANTGSGFSLKLYSGLFSPSSHPGEFV